MIEIRNSGVLRTITVLITICSFSFPAYAKYGGGTGEAHAPYLIYKAEQMNDIGANSNDWDKHFKADGKYRFEQLHGDRFQYH